VVEADVLAVDIHGVVLNSPLLRFVGDIGRRTGEGPDDIRRRWRDDLRRPFWVGDLDEATMWHRLAPGLDPHELRTDLERRYGPGPLFDVVNERVGPTWLLSNHRAAWLVPRLERFGILDRFERVYVSDELRAAKPEPEAFAPLDGVRGLVYVDDSRRNVRAARRCGVDAVALDDVVTLSAMS
jgi:FMN phosphatase YigB (HAD superfamily)